METLLTLDETATILRKPASWLRWAIRQRRIPFVKIGQHIRFRESDIERWIDAATTDATTTSQSAATRLKTEIDDDDNGP